MDFSIDLFYLHDLKNHDKIIPVAIICCNNCSYIHMFHAKKAEIIENE